MATHTPEIKVHYVKGVVYIRIKGQPTLVMKSEDAKKRKKMVEPIFFNWPDDLDFNQSSEFLESIGKMAVPVGTPSQMKKTLAAARLLKYLIDMWQEDEQERGNRKYVEGAEAEITILPNSWLRELN